MMVTILNSAILDSAILVLSLYLTHTCQRLVPNISTKKLHSFILTQLDDCSYLEICHPWFSHFVQKKLHSFILKTWWWHPSICCLGFRPLHKKNFTHSFWLNLMMAAILNSAILDSAILHKKNFKLIHSDSTWWWQPSWILPCWIQTLPSWIQTPCYFLSDSLKNTLPHSDSDSN